MLLCLMLILAVTFAPVLSLAQSISVPVTGDDTQVQMPCHGSASETPEDVDSLQKAPCPHCSTDATASACQCCGHTAPAGLTGTLLVDSGAPVSGPALLGMSAEHLPDPLAETLFRPPILHS